MAIPNAPARVAFVLATCLTLSFAASAQAPVPEPALTAFDAVAFFSGRTTGEGQLKKMFSAAQTTHVTGQGRVESGELVLDQSVTIAGEPRREREWRLRALSPSHWSGTLSDARGPVDATAAGRVLTIAYVSNAGLGITQTVTLAANGRSAHNMMRVRKFGMTVATLDETITRD